MADFSKFIPGLLYREGLYVNNALDSGGETIMGIARAYNPVWPGWQIVDAAKKKLGLVGIVPRSQYQALNDILGHDQALIAFVKALYKKEYWSSLLLDSVKSQALAEQMADHSASAGPSRPAAMIQFAVNQITPTNLPRLTVDAVIGPKTIAAINAADQLALLKAFVELRREHYAYRCATYTPEPPVLALFKSLKIYPDASQRVFLNSWLARLPKF